MLCILSLVVLPPQKIAAGLGVRMGHHPGSREKLEIFRVGIPEQHHHTILAFVIVPLAAGQQDISISVPDPVTLNDFGGGFEGDFRGLDRAIAWIAAWTADHLDLKIIKSVLGQVAIAILEVAIGGVDPPRCE